MAERAGLAAFAITDHMDIRSVHDMCRLAAGSRVRFFPGVEISTVHRGNEHHLLLYGYDPDDGVLSSFLRDACLSAWSRAGACLDMFRRMGFDVGVDDVSGWGFSVPTGVTLLNALLRRNGDHPALRPYLVGEKAASPYVNFYRDFAVGDVGEIVRETLPGLVETMRLLKGRGLLVLAHPGDAPRDFLESLVREGLDGLEVYSTHHRPEQELRLSGLATSLGLMASAGSDFHGERIKPHVAFGRCSGMPDERLVGELARLAGSR